jgi:hypothetical protein
MVTGPFPDLKPILYEKIFLLPHHFIVNHHGIM